MLSAVATEKSTYDLLGTLASPRNRPGCHTKKSSVGKATTEYESKKAGSTVSAGKGQSIVGTPEPSNPIEAGTINVKPQTNVTTPLFSLGSINSNFSPLENSTCGETGSNVR
jgi:hypothetical protein